MKKTLLLFLAIIALSCSSDDNTQTDEIVGKWLIYKAEYENSVYEYDINDSCSEQSLEMLAGSNFVKETYFTNADCTTFTSTTVGEWRKESDGIYNIFPMGQTVPERSLILTDNEILVTEPGFITVIKYYKRAL